MAREGLTGSRIRERRVIAGVKQADLARRIGISASYLNLIEHNRRRIGGKLLLDIAATLGVDATALTEGAEAALIASLREAATGATMPAGEMERAEEFAGRFPGWAEVLASAHRRIGTLERTVEGLTDRMAHDPQLAASVHELLSTAAAIRSTASILAADKSITEEWRDRFHTNIDQDSRRLADSSKSLVNYLDAGQDAATSQQAQTPQEEVEAFLEAHDYGIGEATADLSQTDDPLGTFVEGAPELTTQAARALARETLEQFQADARNLDLDALGQAVDAVGYDPLRLATHFNVPVALMLRRLGLLPSLNAGLVVCDRAGSFLLRKPVAGFTMPRFGAACPLWPLFDALTAPERPFHRRVHQAGRTGMEFDCYALSNTVGEARYNRTSLVHATMLIVPVSARSEPWEQPVAQVGSTCRVCTRVECAGRREASILTDMEGL